MDGKVGCAGEVGWRGEKYVQGEMLDGGDEKVRKENRKRVKVKAMISL
jgi:hypothetical protein